MTEVATPLTEDDIKSLRRNQCPACGNWGLIPGPRGGAGQNVYCADPACATAYMVAPRHAIAIAYRVGKAPEHYYPPQVHIVSQEGVPLCAFAGAITIDYGPPVLCVPVPVSEWPIGHHWVDANRFEVSTCKACRERARS